MKITKEQKEILDSLICERLSANLINEELIQNFASKRGSSLVNYFQKLGPKEEREGKIAYYIIKTKEDEVLMFFSLKCGALFEPLLDEEEVKNDYQRLFILLQAIENANGKIPEVDEVNAILSKYQIGDRISANDFVGLLKKAEAKGNYLRQLLGDKEIETNEKIARVMDTHSGIELVHFCTNDLLKEKWREYNLGHTMGETLFWKFIVPKFDDVKKIVGCEYAFLFAADLSEEGTLVNYYDVSLKFKKRLDVGTNKPFYDFCCEFMCQEVNKMNKFREEFFENFNIDESDVIL